MVQNVGHVDADVQVEPVLGHAATAAAESGVIFGLDTTGVNRGLYVSQDSGQTWSYASVKDGSTTIDAGSDFFVGCGDGSNGYFGEQSKPATIRN